MAVKECIRQGGELAGILLEHRAEVVDMLLTEFDEEAFVRDIREEGIGRNPGRPAVLGCHFAKICKIAAGMRADFGKADGRI